MFIIRRDIEQPFRQTIGSRYEKRLPIAYAFQQLDMVPAGFIVPANRQKPWGTGQAVLITEPLVREPFAVINADDFYGFDSFQALAGHLSRANLDATDYAMVGYTLRHTLSAHGSVSRGVCEITADGTSITFVNSPKSSDSTMPPVTPMITARHIRSPARKSFP